MPSPYPLIYLPRDYDGPIPRHSPHRDITATLPGQGPDDVGDGRVLGGTYDPATHDDWTLTVAGWWILWTDPTPQQLVNLTPSPHLVRWHWIDGIIPAHRWRIPVLLTPQDPDDPIDWNPAANRLWDGQGYSLPPDLDDLQRRLLHPALAIPLADPQDLEANNTAVRHLAIDLAAQGHYVTEVEMVAGRWLDEVLIQDIILAALDSPPPPRAARFSPFDDPERARGG